MSFYEKPVKEIDDIEKPAMKFAERRGWFQCKMTSPSINGMPDRFLARWDRGVVLIEFKAPGKPLRTIQVERIDELRKQGVEVHVFDNLQDAKDFLR